MSSYTEQRSLNRAASKQPTAAVLAAAGSEEQQILGFRRNLRGARGGLPQLRGMEEPRAQPLCPGTRQGRHGVVLPHLPRQAAAQDLTEGPEGAGGHQQQGLQQLLPSSHPEVTAQGLAARGGALLPAASKRC